MYSVNLKEYKVGLCRSAVSLVTTGEQEKHMHKINAIATHIIL